ncbi:MAG: LysR family transcriptional regulator [Pseudomonadota bacterium]
MHNMSWDNLQYLLAIHRSGSLARAANLMGVNQSTVSRRIFGFEQELNAKLLERRPEGAVLSEAGLALCALAENTEADLQIIVSKISETENTVSGKLVIACVDMMVDRFLAPHLAQFQIKNPDIELSILTGLEPVDLMRGKADVALRVSRYPDENLMGRRLCRFGLGIYGAAESEDTTDLGGWIEWSERRHIEAKIPKQLKSLPVNHCTDNFLSMKAMVSAGIGIAILPCYWADADSTLRRVHPGTVSHPNLGLWLLYHPDKKQSPRLRAFVDFITPIALAHQDRFAGLGAGSKDSAF